jgi:hypothetical protein
MAIVRAEYDQHRALHLICQECADSFVMEQGNDPHWEGAKVREWVRVHARCTQERKWKAVG